MWRSSEKQADTWPHRGPSSPFLSQFCSYKRVWKCWWSFATGAQTQGRSNRVIWPYLPVPLPLVLWLQEGRSSGMQKWRQRKSEWTNSNAASRHPRVPWPAHPPITEVGSELKEIRGLLQRAEGGCARAAGRSNVSSISGGTGLLLSSFETASC